MALVATVLRGQLMQGFFTCASPERARPKSRGFVQVGDVGVYAALKKDRIASTLAGCGCAIEIIGPLLVSFIENVQMNC
jgi:hypothetical protein